jgi:hypothetical protein
MNPIVAWIKSLIAEKHGGEMPAAPRTSSATSNATGWAVAAMMAEARNVRHAPSGSRNATLNRAAYKLGQLVAAGMLHRWDVESELQKASAALVDSDGVQSVIKTIESGITAGMKSPRGKA